MAKNDFKLSGGGQKFSAPKVSFGGGGGQGGIAQLMAYMIAQQKGQGLQQQVGPGAIVTGGTDPATGARIESQAGQDFDIQGAGKQKAVTDAVVAIGALKKLLPVLDEFEAEFSRAFPNADSMTGFGGKMKSADIVMKAKMDIDPNLSAALDQLQGKRSQITKGLGEIGNLAEQEQKIAMQNVPELKFQGIQDLILPEAPATGAAKLRKFREFINAQIQQNLNIINSGGDMSTVLKSQNGNGIDDERKKALAAIESGKYDSKKVAAIFRQKTGQELF